MLPACQSAAEYAAQADAEVYELVESRRAALFDERASFTIEPDPHSLRERVLDGEVTRLEELGLADCLEIAAENHRDYQRRKESLYLAALDVTLERWRLGWIPDAGADFGIDGLGDEAQSASGGATLEFSRVLGSGAEIVATLGLGVVKSLVTSDGWDVSTDALLQFTQPILRGAGERIVLENLTQAERDLVYEVRSFERFRRTLAVDIASRLLRVLQQADTIVNEENNYERVKEIRTRNEALSQAGRLSDIQVDQASQDEYSSQTRLIDARQSYETTLDELKLFLGLPPTVELSVRRDELERLALIAQDFEGLEAGQVVAVALESRPDFLTSVDQVDDAERRAYIAADALRMGLDLSASIRFDSDPDEPLRYNFQDADWGVGVLLDLPIDRTPERNAYRASLVSLQRATRDAQQFEDELTVDLRAELRDLAARRESYAIQANAVKLARQRVESAQLNQKAGRASTRDLLEAQSALVSSENAQTRALIDYTLARLTLVLDMGLLRVEPDGLRVEEPPGTPEDRGADE